MQKSGSHTVLFVSFISFNSGAKDPMNVHIFNMLESGLLRGSAMCFSVRIMETETGNNLFPQWCPLRNSEQKQKQLKCLVAPRGRGRLK